MKVVEAVEPPKSEAENAAEPVLPGFEFAGGREGVGGVGREAREGSGEGGAVGKLCGVGAAGPFAGGDERIACAAGGPTAEGAAVEVFKLANAEELDGEIVEERAPWSFCPR